MKKGTVLVKEVIGSSLESDQIAHCISAPFHIKDIFGVKHHVHSVRSVIGKTCVAYFGEIELKIYCVKECDNTVHQICEKIHFKGFSFFDHQCLAKKPEVIVKTQIKDVFTDVACPDTLKIFAVLSTELILTTIRREQSVCCEKHTHSEEEGYQIEILDADNSPGISVEILPES